MANRYFNFVKRQILNLEHDAKDKDGNLWNAKYLLSYDKDTGVFTRLVGRPNAKKDSVAGHMNKSGYVEIFINSKKYLAHRLAWWFEHGYLPSGPVDHINRNKSDNRIANLRASTFKENSENRSLVSKVSKTGWTGVEKLANGYRAAIISGDSRMTFGLFKTEDEAKAAYYTAKTILHKGMTQG